MFARVLALALIIALAVAVIPAFAAEPGTIGPGDTLKITVLGEPDYSKEVVVDSGGSISLPLTKDISVSGKSTSDAAKAIKQRLGKFLKNPDVTVELVTQALQQVTVAGQVKTPGVYPIVGETRLMQIIGKAGGFTDSADSSKVTITRRGNPLPLACDIQSFLSGAKEDANLVLEDGDVILVPEKNPALGVVYVYGSVKTPGNPIPIRDGMRISQAISAAGGVVADQCDLSRTIIKRSNVTDPINVDLAKAMTGDASADLPLQPGDIITVPALEQSGTFTIYGAVAVSGEYPVKGRMTLTRAIALAGGPSGKAKLGDLRLTRAPQNGKTESLKCDLTQIGNGTAPDVEVRPGDTIYVPEKKDRSDMTRWAAIGLTIIGLLIGR